MSKVHVFARPSSRYNLASAEKYGEVVHHNLPSPFDTDRFNEAIQNIDMDDDNDYIALTGPMLSVVMGVIASLERGGAINLLLFNANNDQYVVRTI